MYKVWLFSRSFGKGVGYWKGNLHCSVIIFFFFFYQNKPRDRALSGGKKKGKSSDVYFWTNDDVGKWLRKHCIHMKSFETYRAVFDHHEITGKKKHIQHNKFKKSLDRISVMTNESQNIPETRKHVFCLI